MNKILLAAIIPGLAIASAIFWLAIHKPPNRPSTALPLLSTNASPGPLVAQQPVQSNSTSAVSPNVPANQGTSTNAVGQEATSQDRSELDLAVGSVALPMITNPSGLRTGEDSSNTNSPLQEIAQSTYFEDSMGAPSGSNHFITIVQPTDGKYSIILTAAQTGNYELSIRAFSSDGASQPEILHKGYLQKGSQSTLILNYTSAPGAVSSLLDLTE